MTKNPPFSIIICLYKITDTFYKDLQKYQKLIPKQAELLLVVEKDATLKKITVPVTIIRAKKKPISLGEKRDLGFLSAKGKYCAYIDDDAYPHAYWLRNALKLFQSDTSIGAVGGPNLTPPEDSFWAKIGGYIYESYFTSGGAQFRFIPKKRMDVSELQGVNMIIRKDILTKLGGFHFRLSSGDDSKICSNIHKLGFKVLYDPDVRVFHHRRKFPLAHLKQIKSIGTHRGFFVKAFPQTRSIIYFLPIVLILGIILAIVGSFISSMVFTVSIILGLILFSIGYSASIKRAGWNGAIFVVIGILVTHIVYGIFFIRGMFLKKI